MVRATKMMVRRDANGSTNEDDGSRWWRRNAPRERLNEKTRTTRRGSEEWLDDNDLWSRGKKMRGKVERRENYGNGSRTFSTFHLGLNFCEGKLWEWLKNFLCLSLKVKFFNIFIIFLASLCNILCKRKHTYIRLLHADLSLGKLVLKGATITYRSYIRIFRM